MQKNKPSNLIPHVWQSRFQPHDKAHLAPVFNSPENFGVEYEDVTFKAQDGVTLSGGLIKRGTDKVIVQSHFGAQEHIHHFFVNKANNQFLNSNDTVGQIAYSLGFEHPQHFSRVFKAKTGMSPG